MYSVEQTDMPQAKGISANFSRDRSHIRKLPQELLDMVVDFLCGDWRSLEACTLVLREWICGARRHLFHYLSISSPLADFLTFLRHAPPSVTTHVHQLQLEHPDHTSLRLCDIADVASYFPSLNILMLYHVRIAMNSDGTLCGGLPNSSPKFTRLHLDHMMVDMSILRHLLLLCAGGATEINFSTGCWATWVPRSRRAVLDSDDTLSLTEDEIQAFSRISLDAFFIGSTRSSIYNLAVRLVRQTTTLNRLEYLECNSAACCLPQIQELIAGCSQYLKCLALEFDYGRGDFFLVWRDVRADHIFVFRSVPGQFEPLMLFRFAVAQNRHRAHVFRYG